jgi:regulatory protein
MNFSEEMIEKARRYCLRGEKCKQDVLQKLFQWKIPESFHSDIIEQLINERFIDETRFAQSFVHDKYLISKWGKKKIYYALKNKQVNDVTIRDALDNIDEERYLKNLEDIAQGKIKVLKRKNDSEYIQRNKLMAFLLQRGFEMDEILQLDYFKS